MVFTTVLLKRGIELFYERIAAVLNLELRLRVYNPRMPLHAIVKVGNYGVIEKVVIVMLNHAETLIGPKMLALSAMPYSKITMERELVEEVLKFRVIVSMMECSVSFESLKTCTTNASVEKFFAGSQGYVRLIYMGIVGFSVSL